MSEVHGVSEFTRMRHLMRTVRAKFVANVRNKVVKPDPEALAYFDKVLGEVDAKSKAVSRQR